MFTCNLYISNSEKNKVDKNLTLLEEKVNCIYKDDTNVLNPTILLEFSEQIKNVNYIYLSDKNRYYFITNKKMTNGGKIALELEVDVLTSFKSEIRNIEATITRNENKKNGYLVDNQYKVYAYEQVVCKSFPRGLTNDSIILMTVG